MLPLKRGVLPQSYAYLMIRRLAAVAKYHLQARQSQLPGNRGHGVFEELDAEVGRRDPVRHQVAEETNGIEASLLAAAGDVQSAEIGLARFAMTVLGG